MPIRNISDLQPMTGDITPITLEERLARIEKARQLMVENQLDAIYLEPGSGLFYFTGVKWGRSERMMAAVIPAMLAMFTMEPGAFRLPRCRTTSRVIAK